MKKSGFTLVEVLVSLTVFSVGILAVYTVSTQAKILSRTSGIRTKAALLAQEGIELAIADGYEQLTTDTPYLDEPSLVDLGPSFAPFSRLVTVQYVDENVAPTATDKGMKLISVRIEWSTAAPDPNELSRVYEASTILTNI